MNLLRRVLFWTHLTLGLAAGLVILVMCVTGVALTYEKQVLEWADRQRQATSPEPRARLAPEALLTAAVAWGDGHPTVLTLRADQTAPATVTFERGRAQLVGATSGRALGEPSPRLRQFFRQMTSWHRWLALEGASRPTGRLVTGAANLGFLFIVMSGAYLWLPSAFTRTQLRQVLWFRGGLTPKARDFNWHNVIGIWSVLPLALVVAGAVPISYGWAGNLVYRLAGETPPAATGDRSNGRGARAEDPEASAGALARGLDAAMATAAAAVPDWRTATVRFGVAESPLTVIVDRGAGGQPQYRTTFTVSRDDARVLKEERFEDLGPGRQWRTWFRFVHTGEYYGLAGQTIAGVASAGGAVLVYTGVALALRRFVAWRRRRAATALRTASA